MNGLVLVTIGVSFLFLGTNAAWLYWSYRHKSKCSWYKVHEVDVMEIRDALWDLHAKGHAMVEITRVDPSNLYRVRP